MEQSMANWDLLLTDARIATMRRGVADFGIIEQGSIAIHDGAIAWVGPTSELPAGSADVTRSLGRCWVTPALIDCHSHLVFGGDRGAEFARRLAGVSYQQIALSGSGILATVHATRAASASELFEIKMLEVARRLGRESGLTVRTTLLAAHAVAPEFRDNPDAYVDLICEELLPLVAERGLADAVDAYCESIAFDSQQIGRVFARAESLGLPVKLHADQLSDGDGAALAARWSALSADHLEYTSASGVAAMAKAGTVAVLLPGAFLTLNETRRPPVAALRDNDVPIAVATDCNPGTSPLTSLTTAMALASRLFGLTPEECLAGTTREAARALALEADRGTLEVGKRADLAVWTIDHPRDLSYWLGSAPLSSLLIAGHEAGTGR
jgi:imidazolonepropionase